jgi:hypothetical protein
VAAVGAIGATVIAGLQLTQFSGADSPGKLLISVLAVAMALFGIGAILLKAGDVLSVEFTSVTQLAQLERDGKPLELIARVPPFPLSFKRTGAATASPNLNFGPSIRLFSHNLADSATSLQRRLDHTYQVLSKLRVEDSYISEAPSRKYTEADIPVLQVEQAALERASETLIVAANNWVTIQRFREFQNRLIVGGILVALGVAGFALATRRVSPAAPISQPTAVAITFVTDDIRATLVGKDCPPTPLAGVALKGSWSKPEVVTLPTPKCRAARILLDSKTGIAIPVSGPVPRKDVFPTSTTTKSTASIP